MPNPKTVVYDFCTVAKLIRSVSAARVTAQGMKMNWLPVDDVVINTLYNISNMVRNNQRPGTYEVELPNMKYPRIQKEVLADMTQSFTAFFKAVESGPAATHKFLDGQARLRAEFLDTISGQLRGAAKANQMTFNIFNNFIADCNEVVATSAVILAACGLYVALGVAGPMVIATPAGLMFVAGSTGAEIATGGVLATVGVGAAEITTANMVALVRTLATHKKKGAAETAGEKVVENRFEHYAHGICEKQVARYETTIPGEEELISTCNKTIEMLRSKVLPFSRAQRKGMVKKLARQVAKSEAVVAAQQTARMRIINGLAQTGARWIPIVFAAHDVYEAVENYPEALDLSEELRKSGEE